jgi:O-antigen/teichoic acid export membrane protein
MRNALRIIKDAPSGNSQANSHATATDAGRLRSRRLATGIFSALGSRGLAALSPLLLIPVTLPALGDQLYGLWMTILAMTAMAMWADLGLGNGLLTKLTQCIAEDDDESGRSYISTAYLVVGGVAGLLLLFTWSSRPLLDWPALLGSHESLDDTQATSIALVCLSVYLINIPMSLIQRVQYASQMVTQSNLWQAAGALISLVFAVIAVHADMSATMIVASASSGPLIANIVNSLVFYLCQHRNLAPRFTSWRPANAGLLMKLGSQFFVLSVATSVALSSDNLLVAHALSLHQVTVFSVPARVVGSLGLLITLLNLPLWPANGEALARGDIEWIRRTTRRMMIASTSIVACFALLLLTVGPALMTHLFNSPLAVPRSLLLALCAWWLIVAAASPRAMAQNASGDLRPQLIGWLAFLVLSLPLKWFAATNFGLTGMVIAGILVYVVTVWPATTVGYRRVLVSSTASEHEALAV